MASSSRSLINLKRSTSLPSSSTLDLFNYMPTPKRIKTASTSLPSSSSSSSSASSPNLKWTYDVFLSFRGEDTRNNFVDHLFMNLTQKGINTFRDEEKLERGKEISGDLLKAIEESRFAIIIFSENYASSSWCLDELVKIIDCTKETGQITYPVFYNVDPSNVRKQEGSFAKAFDKHLEKNVVLEKMEKWREALTHAGSISGWDTRNRHEAKIIQEIVEKIFDKLSHALLHVDDHLVGMEIRMEEINTHLNLGSNDVKFVGIHGLGGIGKTTTAKVIYNWISYQFEGCSYLKNVRGSDLVSLQKQLLYDILNVDMKISNDDSGSFIIQSKLKTQKVLIILDDVDQVNQLEKLAGNGKWFGPGSRIIITTRNQHLLNIYDKAQKYEVKECDRDKSLGIFSWKAFKQNCPLEDYKELSNEVVRYAQGLPLALTVLGSHLCDRNKDAWRGAIDQLSIIPNKDINDILKISYEGLEELQKNVFLDIACFFIGEDKDEVMKKLDTFGFFPSINIQVLIDKSLITVSTENELMMHDLVRDMGRHFVRQESPENPGKWSRLWNTEDIRQVLENNMATKAIKGIKTYMYEYKCNAGSFKAEAFMVMKNLRFLELPYYPGEHLALDFPHDKLVHLSLRDSSIKSLWNGRKADLPHLKSLDLSCSEHLREFPDVTGLPKLERLSLEECSELVEIHPSVWVHKGLKFLDLDDCLNLVGSFPNKIEMESLETLSLIGSSIKSLWNGRQADLPRLKSIDLSYSKRLREFPDVTGLPNLERLSLGGCWELVEIHPSVWVHKGLKFLDLSGCSNLESFPNKIEMESLETLYLRESSIKSLLNGRQADLPHLKSIDLHSSKLLKEFPDVTGLPNLERLSLRGCSELVEIHPSVWVHKGLKFLNLSGCSNLVWSFPNKIEMDSLETLSLIGSSIKSLWNGRQADLPRLKSIELSGSLRLRESPDVSGLPNLERLSLRGCSELVEIHPSVWVHKGLKFLDLSFYGNLVWSFPNKIEMDSLETLSLSNSSIKSLWNGRQADLPHLKFIDLSASERLREFPDVTGLPNLERLSLRGCSELVEIHPSVWVHKGLKFLNLSGCSNLVWSFPNKIEMESLETLDLGQCKKIEEFPEVHGNMKRLSKLVLSSTKIKELPSSIENFTPLKILLLSSCKNLVCLPSSICKLKYLEELHLYDCSALEKLPENIGDLESLVELNASLTAIKEVPSSIQSLDKLRKLSFYECRSLKLPSFDGLPSSLTDLNLSCCNLTDETFPSNIECLSSLKTLHLSGNNFESLPTNITQLPLLTKLDLRRCERLKSVPRLPSRISIDIDGCESLSGPHGDSDMEDILQELLENSSHSID